MMDAKEVRRIAKLFSDGRQWQNTWEPVPFLWFGQAVVVLRHKLTGQWLYQKQEGPHEPQPNT